MEFNIEEVENGFIVKYKCKCTYATKSIVLYTFEELIQELAKYYNQIGIGENYAQVLKGIGEKKQNQRGACERE